jgi:hypothetical protein
MSIPKKLLKYTVFAVSIFLFVFFITKSKISNFDSLAIALAGTSIFALLDQYAPSYVIEEKP